MEVRSNNSILKSNNKHSVKLVSISPTDTATKLPISSVTLQGMIPMCLIQEMETLMWEEKRHGGVCQRQKEIGDRQRILRKRKGVMTLEGDKASFLMCD